MSLTWIDGHYHDRATAMVSVFDHGLLYGDGVFEGIRAYNGRIFRLDRHLERLYGSAKGIWLDVPLPAAELGRVVEEAVGKSGIKDAYIRLVVTRGVGDLTALTAATPINHRESLSPRIKSLNYLSHILAKVEGIAAGVDEVIMLDSSGYVAEASGMNLGMVKRGVVRTPPPYAGILRGVTRDAILELAREAGYGVDESPLNRYDLYTADEVFLTGTAAEVVGVAKLDGRVIGTGKAGPVTRDLFARFRALATRGD